MKTLPRETSPIWGYIMNVKSLKQKISYYFEYKWMTGHINIGRLTIYGRNAMRWGCHFWTNRWGYICFRLPLRCDKHWYPLYLYCSPDATPQSSTFFVGGGRTRRQEWATARLRKCILGHNWKRDELVSEYDITKYDICRAINNRVDIYMFPYAKYAKDHGYDTED